MLKPKDFTLNPQSAQDKRQFDFINLLRGGAAWLVVYFHLHIHIFHGYPKRPIEPGSLTARFILGDFDLGRYGLAVFFMVSGFLIPSTLSGPGANLRKFWIQRIFRLYPAYWFSIAVLAAMPSFLTVNRFDRKLLPINLTMLQKFVGADDVIGAFWTLPIELIFYALCAIMFFWKALEKRQAAIWVSLGVAGYCAAFPILRGETLPLTIFLALVLMFLGDTIRAHDKAKVTWPHVLKMSGVVALSFIPICLVGYGSQGPRYLLSNWAALLTFLTAYKYQRFWARAPRLRALATLLGHISYGVYLLHDPVGLRLGTWLFEHGQGRLTTALAVIASTFAAAYFCYRCIEAPCIQWGRKLARGSQGRPPQAAVV